MNIDQIPTTARRALALWTTLGGVAERVGGSNEIVALDTVLLEGVVALSPPPGEVFLVAVLRDEGTEEAYNQHTHTHTHTQHQPCLRLALVAGSINRQWWEGEGKEQTRLAWNALDHAEREREWKAWVGAGSLDRLVVDLLAGGVMTLVDQTHVGTLSGGGIRGQA